MSEYTITDVRAKEVFNCLWVPTVEAQIYVNGKPAGKAIAPQGHSVGAGEAHEVRDGGNRLGGEGCLRAVKNVNNEIRNALVGMDVTEQRKLDRMMMEVDGTADKGRLGANAIVAVSAACARAAANTVGIPLYRYLNSNSRVLPIPMMSVLDGGQYAYGHGTEFQEFNYFPTGFDSLREALEVLRVVHNRLGELLVETFGSFGRMENSGAGYSTMSRSHYQALDLMTKSIEDCGYMGRIGIGIDCAASHWYNSETGLYSFEGKDYDRAGMMDIYKDMIAKYPIITMEDPFEENDVEGHALAVQELGIQIVGDDLFVTNPSVMKERIAQGAANAMLWKYNQVGTITEALDAAEIARSNSYAIQASERSGETDDCILADLLVAINAGQFKGGIVARGEHTRKYNRLLTIEDELGPDAIYPGKFFSNPFMK